ncbi:MAG TPA: tannase/feruloyl esterase family alpha/beta hydrolase, partial [Candidatus Binatia bacterium]
MRHIKVSGRWFANLPVALRYFRSRPIFALASLLVGAALMSLGASSGQNSAADPATACANLAGVSKFPVTPTQITLAKWNPNGTTSANGVPLPDHCQIQGVINQRIGIDGYPYGDRFEVRLPSPALWNGRFMFQGGGGTEGSVPAATGSAGTLSPALAHGWAVASQDGGHENSQLPFSLEFALDPQAVADHAYRSIQVVTQTAKFLITAVYGKLPDFSYSVGCSTGGRQGMVFSQNFPEYFDGIVAGDPVYDLQAIALSEDWGVEQIKAITPAPIQTTPSGSPILYPAFPVADQQLFTRAILQACDALDGVADGVIDDLKTCQAQFDPATYIFSDTGQPLQCAGAKTASCLSQPQINAVKNINQGPRNAAGEVIEAPAGAAVHPHPDNTVVGYPYDGGFMAPSGIPSRKIGTPTSTPGDFALGLGQIPYLWITPANPSLDPLSFNFDTDVADLTRESPLVSTSTSLNIEKFRNRGGKIIWYHGLSDPGPSVSFTIEYYTELAKKSGGLRHVLDFSRLYLIPNMGHCSGGPSTDQFDALSPLVAWVEHGVEPKEIIASGRNFTSAPTTRSRPLCPYPQEARYIGAAG